jgi:uncharacterized protein (TIGR00251 family)
MGSHHKDMKGVNRAVQKNQTCALNIPFKKSKGGILLTVKVQPGSSKKGIEGVSGDTLMVKLTSQPRDGAANEQLIELLSEELGIRKSLINIIKGHKSRHKVVEIKGSKKSEGIHISFTLSPLY